MSSAPPYSRPPAYMAGTAATGTGGGPSLVSPSDDEEGFVGASFQPVGGRAGGGTSAPSTGLTGGRAMPPGAPATTTTLGGSSSNGKISYASVPARSPSPTGFAGPATSFSSSDHQHATMMNTLDEPVWQTIKRDLVNIWSKLRIVLFPGGRKDILRDWDWWGPLLLCLTLSSVLSLMAPAEQKAAVFTGVFVIVWFGAAVITLNSTLLGGKISFFQSVCVLGYCVFPLVIASIVCLFVPILFIRVVFVSAAFGWCVVASTGFLSESGLERRKWLAVYPIFLFYFLLGWIVLISKSLV